MFHPLMQSFPRKNALLANSGGNAGMKFAFDLLFVLFLANEAPIWRKPFSSQVCLSKWSVSCWMKCQPLSSSSHVCLRSSWSNSTTWLTFSSVEAVSGRPDRG